MDPYAIVIILLLLTYFVPAFVARSRDHNNYVAIAMLNLFLGWTLLGWVAALVWACTDHVADPEPARPLPTQQWPEILCIHQPRLLSSEEVDSLRALASAMSLSPRLLTPQEMDSLQRSLGRPW
jgi:hypothetical protein